MLSAPGEDFDAWHFVGSAGDNMPPPPGGRPRTIAGADERRIGHLAGSTIQSEPLMSIARQPSACKAAM